MAGKFSYDIIHKSPNANGAWACVSNSSNAARGSGVVDLLALLNQCGEEGWEVCGSVSMGGDVGKIGGDVTRSPAGPQVLILKKSTTL